jgi:hypothetical protein
MEIIAQTISVIAMAVSIFALQFKTNRSLYICRGASGLLFAISYFMLGIYTAGALNLINLIRSAFLINKRTQSKIFMIISILMYWTATAFTFAGYLSLIIVISQTFETVVLWGRNGKHIRVYQVCVASPAWLYHNIVRFSLGGILAEVFLMISTFVSFFRFRKTGFDKT